MDYCIFIQQNSLISCILSIVCVCVELIAKHKSEVGMMAVKSFTASVVSLTYYIFHSFSFSFSLAFACQQQYTTVAKSVRFYMSLN